MTAIEGIATTSAWARWYAAKLLTINERCLLPRASIFRSVASELARALRDGKLKAKGRPSHAILYEEIPKDAWWLVYIEVIPNPATLWQANLRAL